MGRGCRAPCYRTVVTFQSHLAERRFLLFSSRKRLTLRPFDYFNPLRQYSKIVEKIDCRKNQKDTKGHGSWSPSGLQRCIGRQPFAAAVLVALQPGGRCLVKNKLSGEKQNRCFTNKILTLHNGGKHSFRKDVISESVHS